jgi:biotin operon repressor
MANTLEAEGAGMGDPGRIPATTPDDVLGVFADRDDRGEPLTAPELADRLNCSRRTALNKLHDLEDRDDVASKKVGGRSKVWWRPIPRDQSPPASARESTAASGDESAGGGSTPQPRGEGETRSTTPHGGESADGVARALESAVAALDTTDERRDAVRACVDHLREHGTAQRKDFLTALYPEHAAGFGSEGGWWNKIGKEHLSDVAERVDVLKSPPKEGSHTWRYPPAIDDGDGEGDA